MRKSLFNQSGQTLVEAIVAIAIAVVLVTAVVALAIQTQRAAQTSRNQSQNTRYGEEALEKIRNIRDLNLTGSIRSTNMTSFTCFGTNTCKFSDLYSVTSPSPLAGTNASGGYYFILAYNATGCGGAGCWDLTRDTSGAFQTISGTIYSQRIRVWDNGQTFAAQPNPALNPDPIDRVKFVEVTIRWTDAAGDHNSTATTKLTNFR